MSVLQRLLMVAAEVTVGLVVSALVTKVIEKAMKKEAGNA